MNCKHCGGLIAIRNPRGDCDHLYWPDMLTDQALIANGFLPRDPILQKAVDLKSEVDSVGNPELSATMDAIMKLLNEATP